MEQIASYTNGNTEVKILSDGTKIREWDGVPFVCHPESIDVKISDYCDLGCPYCHESSTVNGLHGNLLELANVIRCLPKGVELALGGGNPLSHPDLIRFLQGIKKMGLIANITINQGHLKRYSSMIEYLIKEDLVKGVGISITSSNYKHIEPILELTENVVYHLIAGVNKVSLIDDLISLGECKVLVLGYKSFGFGVNYKSDSTDLGIKEWYKKLPSYIGKCTLSFDNLAIEQLNARRLFTQKGWDKFYMGDDFSFTMYIDAVKKEYAKTSRSSERVSFNDATLSEFFQSDKKTKQYE